MFEYEENITSITKVVFDLKGRFIAGYGETSVLVMDLEENKKLHQKLDIDTDYFEKIFHIRFYSLQNPDPETGDEYRYYVAVKK